MSFCSITCDRGDRKPFMDFCKHQIERFTVKPDKSYFIDHDPKSTDVDLIERVWLGLRMAAEDGFNEVYILESDDFYPANYFEKMQLGDADFVGEDKTTYYNLRNRTWQTMQHNGRSSLFITGFKISALKDFKPPEKFLDVALWEHAKRRKLKRKYVETGAIGIKHNLGLCGGKGHVLRMKHEDYEMQWLKENTTEEAYVFYKSLNL